MKSTLRRNEPYKMLKKKQTPKMNIWEVEGIRKKCKRNIQKRKEC